MASVSDGQRDQEAVFGSTRFKLDYLTKPSFLHDIGLGALDRIDAAKNVQESDRMFVIAYPHFNVGGESRSSLCILDTPLLNHEYFASGKDLPRRDEDNCYIHFTLESRYITRKLHMSIS